MKIPKTAAKWMRGVSLAAFLGGSAAPLYFFKESRETLENSPTYMGAKDIEKELFQYKSDIVTAAPRTNDDPLEKCVELTNKYGALENKLTNLKNDPEYLATTKKAEILESHARKSPYVGFMFLIPFVAGGVAYRRREREEYYKELYELEKEENKKKTEWAKQRNQAARWVRGITGK